MGTFPPRGQNMYTDDSFKLLISVPFIKLPVVDDYVKMAKQERPDLCVALPLFFATPAFEFGE